MFVDMSLPTQINRPPEEEEKDAPRAGAGGLGDDENAAFELLNW